MAVELVVVALGASEPIDEALAGSKGAHLDRALRAGFPVPRGAIVTTAGFEQHVAEHPTLMAALRDLHAAEADDADAFDRARAAIVKCPIGGLQAELRALYDSFPGGGSAPTLAVRSSSTAEDRREASAAGLYTTVLNVRTFEALLDAVRTCWASLYSPPAVQYSRAKGIPDERRRMAVLVQQMVPTEAAGIMFTANPVRGTDDEIVITATPGLGETAVSGQTAVDTFYVSKSLRLIRAEIGRKTRYLRDSPTDETEWVDVPKGDEYRPALSVEQMQTLACLASDLEPVFGERLDVEFGFQGGTLCLLQIRPITTMAAGRAESAEQRLARWFPIEWESQEDAERAWVIEGDHHNLPLSTMGGSIWERVRRRLRVFNGYWYDLARGDQCARPLRESTRAPTAEIDWLPSGTEDLLHSWRAAAAGVTRLLDRTMATDRSSMDREALADHVDEFFTSWGRRVRSHLPRRIFVLAGASYEDVRLHFFRRLLAVLDREAPLDSNGVPQDAELALLLSGDNRSKRRDRALQALARRVRSSRFLGDLFATSDDIETWRRIKVGDGGGSFRESVLNFLRFYGTQSSDYDVVSPTLHEEPTRLIAIIRRLLDEPSATRPVGGAGRVPRVLLSEVEDRIGQTAPTHRAADHEIRRFRKALEVVRQTWAIKESRDFYSLRAWGIGRMLLREAGSRLAAAGGLHERDDVFHLTLDEMLVALRTEQPRAHLRERAATNRRRWELQSRTRPPVMIQGVYREYRRSGDSRRTLAGVAASPGTREGAARVLRTLDELPQLQLGEILVCRMTTPTWTPAFLVAGAVVTDYGGFGSHAALIAREYGVPCVTGTESASDELKTGMWLRVDGDAGEVHVLRDASV